MPKATAVFDVDDSRLSSALERIHDTMLRHAVGAYSVTACSPNAGAAAVMWRSLVWMAVHPSFAAQVRCGASAARRKIVDGSALTFRRAALCRSHPRNGIRAAWRMWPMRTAFSSVRKKTR